MLAELPISDPRRAFFICLERECIDEDRLASQELNVKRDCVLEYHSVLQRPLLYLECQKGSVLQLSETPFIRIRNKWYFLRTDDPIHTFIWRSEFCVLVRDKQSFVDQRLMQSRFLCMFPMSPVSHRDPSIQNPVFYKKRTAGV